MSNRSIQSKAVELALAEKGYKEGSRNWTKFARDSFPSVQNQAWCGSFVGDVYKRAGFDLRPHVWVPFVPYVEAWAKKIGAWKTTRAQVGDLVIYGFGRSSGQHIGISYPNENASGYRAIEGNTSSGNGGSQSNGDGVYVRVRNRSDIRGWVDMAKVLAHYGVKGGAVAKPVTKPVATVKNVWETSPRIKAMSKAEVKAIQALLVGAGYSVGKSGIDGSYKADTVNAVRAAQKALKQDIDGVAGPDTVAALKKAQKATKPAAKPAPAKGLAPLKITGKLDKPTAIALQTFLVSRGANLKVDGKCGNDTWEALQHYLKAPFKDGKIDRQSHKASVIGDAITQGWKYTGPNSKGSQTITLLQKWVGVKADGVAGPDTIKGLQRKLNEHKVGYAG